MQARSDMPDAEKRTTGIPARRHPLFPFGIPEIVAGNIADLVAEERKPKEETDRPLAPPSEADKLANERL